MSFGSTTIEARSSTSTLLGANETFTGKRAEVALWSSVSVYVSADTDSSPLGLKLQFSADGELWDTGPERSVTVGEPLTVDTDIRALYFRVVYTNGSAPQGAFSIQTICHRYSRSSLSSDDPGSYVPVRLTGGDSFSGPLATLAGQDTIIELLGLAIDELRIANVHRSRITDEVLTVRDIEEQ